MLLTDQQIRDLCSPGKVFTDPCKLFYEKVARPLLNPFSEGVVGDNKISYGLTSAGYDLRMDEDEVLVFKNSYGVEVDPKRFREYGYRDLLFDRRSFKNGDKVVIPAHGYVLCKSYEYIVMPKFLKARIIGKSTYARVGIIVNCTPAEPEWEGHLTLEISNANPCPAVIYAGEGIAQMELELLMGYPEVTYKDKQGKYQCQTGVTTAIVN